ncbi:MAG: branched-chain amino acid ABC transporter permease [Candidatus Hermodarchaeota archaeon]
MPDALIQFLIFGIFQGSVYALLAMGFSLVYGVGGILNQAHGAFYIIATYIFYWSFINIPVFGLLVGIIVALIVTTIVGGLIYILLIEPLKESHVGVVIVTFGFAFFIEQLVGILVDKQYHDMQHLIPGSIDFFGVNLPYHYILVVIVSISLVVLITVFINKLKLGKSIRAVAQDAEAASLMGINVNRILAYTLMISAFLASVAAIFNVPVDIVAPHIGWTVLLNSFSIVVLGGLGSLSGSVVGAYIIAFARAFTNYFISPILSALIPIIVIVVMLVLRPRGIFGKKEIS